jgi:hypothetical protein
MNQKHTKLKKFCSKKEILQTLSLSLSLSLSQYHHTRAHPTRNPNFQELPKSAQKENKTVAQVSS